MAISETTLKDTVLFMIDEQNKKGGVLGKKLEAVVVDPASNWPLFAEKARELITKDKVAVVFGCWTSVSRKSVLPVFKELNSILFYPVQYEGEESERNVFYTGAAPNQQAIPAVDYLMKEEKVKRWVLAGTDYVYPRTTNKILEAYLKSKGVKQEDIMINYTPFGHSDWQTIVADIKKFGSAGKKTAVVSTINGDANVPFYKELGNQGIKATDIPVVAFSVGEEELAGIDTKPLLGHLAAWNYFESIKTPANEKFIKEWQAYTKNPKRVTNDPMEAHVHRLQHVGEGGREGEVDRRRQGDRRAARHRDAKNLTGGTSKMLPNHHITKPVFIGEIKGNGQFDVVWKTPGLVAGDAWSKELRRLQGPDRRLGQQEVRQLQHQDQQVRRSGLLISCLNRIRQKPGRRRYAPPSPLLLPGSSSACQCSSNASVRCPFALLLVFAMVLPVFAGPFEDAVGKFANDDFSDTEDADRRGRDHRGNPLAYTDHQRAAGRPADRPIPTARKSMSPSRTARSSMPRPALPLTSMPDSAAAVRLNNQLRRARRSRARRADAAVAGSGQADPGRAVGFQDPRREPAAGDRRRAGRRKTTRTRSRPSAKPARRSCCSRMTRPMPKSSTPSPPSRRAATRKRWRC